MAKRSFRSKIVALVIVLLTVSAIVAIITMVVLYNNEISTMNPTARPTFSPATTGPPPVMRLPKDLVPHSYRIYLQPHMYTEMVEVENATSPNQTYLVTGNSTVHFHCVQETATIYLHSKHLTVIGDAVVRNTKDNSRINTRQMIPHNDQSDFLEIPLEKPLEAGENYSLSLAFKTEIPNTVKAMCIISFKNDQADSESEGGKNMTRYILATQLEPTHAREVFPCFDEPEMKAVFNVTIIHRRGTVALGNADKSGTTLIDDEWQFTTFYPTPKMSTYLFALTVSEFTATSSQHERVKINTYARPEATLAGKADYAANVTVPILSFFEEYSGINYQQTKLDQIATPRFVVSGMENWGLVTYEESSLLYNEEESSTFQKEGIAKLIAHELAHQWFGNLVTMKWWNQIWLNEGFATYMSYLALAHIEPTYKMDEMFSSQILYPAFHVDALETSHPLNPPEEDVQTLDEIHYMFDAITYCKGAVVLRMLADILDEKVFQKGIRKYLSGLSYKNAEQKDLWEYMQMAVNEDSGQINVAKMMEAWTTQIGYPVVTINTTTGEISQKHFLLNDSAESSLWWYIPVKVMSATSKPTYISLTSSNPERKEELISKDGEWILANVNLIGYYRVNYDPKNWERLLNDLETGQQGIPLVNRIQLVDDAFNLARAKLIDITMALNSTRYLRNEVEFLPWEIANLNMQYLHEMFDRTEVYGPMQTYLRNQVKGLYHHFSNYTNLSEVPEDVSEQQNQHLAIEMACHNGLPECLEMASEKFANWMRTDNNTINSNLRDLIYCYALAAGGEKEWEFAWDKFQNSNESDKAALLQALACTTKVWLLNRYLEYTLDEEKIHMMDALAIIRGVARNVAGHALAWNFMRANWDDSKHGYLEILTGIVTKRFSTQFELDELKRFAADQDLSDMQEMKQAVERTQVNIKWVSEHKEVVLQWFRREAGS